MTGLEALKQVKNFLGYNYCSVDLPNELEVIEKSLKALEIIKEKLVDVSLIKKYDFVADYNSAVWIAGRPKLVKEEFNLLKEVLEWAD